LTYSALLKEESTVCIPVKVNHSIIITDRAGTMSAQGNVDVVRIDMPSGKVPISTFRARALANQPQLRQRAGRTEPPPLLE
jgi:hypothetical protein